MHQYDFDIEESDADEAFYHGIERRALLTSYLDYYRILKDIPKGETLIDLGAGYCRGTLLSEYLNLSRCISIELDQLKTKQAKEFNGSGDIICTSILDFNHEPYNYFFLYFPVNDVLIEFIKKILLRSRNAVFYLIESHGDLVDLFLSFDSFNLESKLPLSSQRHKDHIYKLS